MPSHRCPRSGFGSDIGQLSGGADVRAIDAGAVESIVMIGDSITVGATPALEEQFQQLGFTDVTIVAQQDKRIGQSFGDNSSGADIATFLANEMDGDPKSTCGSSRSARTTSASTTTSTTSSR